MIKKLTKVATIYTAYFIGSNLLGYAAGTIIRKRKSSETEKDILIAMTGAIAMAAAFPVWDAVQKIMKK